MCSATCSTSWGHIEGKCNFLCSLTVSSLPLGLLVLTFSHHCPTKAWWLMHLHALCKLVTASVSVLDVKVLWQICFIGVTILGGASAILPRTLVIVAYIICVILHLVGVCARASVCIYHVVNKWQPVNKWQVELTKKTKYLPSLIDNLCFMQTCISINIRGLNDRPLINIRGLCCPPPPPLLAISHFPCTPPPPFLLDKCSIISSVASVSFHMGGAWTMGLTSTTTLTWTGRRAGITDTHPPAQAYRPDTF